ncbi:MAG: ParA family protein [Lachnospiraceae bacterium]|nr:ParA family protein [Lachnospiraceae bacterium]MCR5477263.1 AAA family ATPase [Lachnospiraceae bacterium]
MKNIYAIANQKGGVGKSSTAVNLGAFIGELGKKVLVIDMDSQGNTTSSFGVNKNEVENTVYELLSEECTIKECLIPDVAPNVSLIPSNVNLAAAEVEFIEKERPQFILKKEIKYVADDFDYIFIDCPPAINLLTLNALTAASGVIVPVQCEYLALEGLSQLIESINLVRTRMNDELELSGILFTMFDARTILSTQVVENVTESAGRLGYRIFKTKIPRNVRLSEAPSFGKPIGQYDPKCAGAEAYRNLAKELLGMPV